MYRPLAGASGNVVAYHFSGTITRAEIQEIHREIKSAIEEHGRIRILLEIADLDFPEASAVIEDLKLTPQYLRDVERYAIVGDKPWESWLAAITSKITKGEAGYFENDDLDAAWAWIRQ